MPALLPAVALATGVAVGIDLAPPAHSCGVAVLVALIALATAACAYVHRQRRTVAVAAAIGYAACGMALGERAATDAIDTPLRAMANEIAPGFLLGASEWGTIDAPVMLAGTLRDDASVAADDVRLTVDADSLVHSDAWRSLPTVWKAEVPTAGGVRVTVRGDLARTLSDRWTAGRRIRAPILLRRPGRYLDDGVPDGEQRLALAGTTLVGSVKSGALVDVVGRGGWWQERTAAARAWARQVIAARAAPAGPEAAGIVTAILIGDRAGLTEPVRDRLQRAGTYHVIAISGGNIALLVATILTVLALTRCTGRIATLLALAGVVGYASVVSGGASVVRATIMAAVYLGARLLDHRSPPLNAVAATVALMLAADPLDLVDVGFGLTVGATVGILLVAHRWDSLLPKRWALRAPAALLLASIAAEVALLPLSASSFLRVTVAGLLLNFAAIPLMSVAQIGGLLTLIASPLPMLSTAAGAVASYAAAGLVASASVVDRWPWLAWRIPAPPSWLAVLYYAAWLAPLVIAFPRDRAARWCRGVIHGSTVVAVTAGVAIATGWPVTGRPEPGTLRVTSVDVGQGDATLVQFPDGRSMLVDAGGGTRAGFNIGTAVVSPALWARGVRRLDWLLLTHGDPDHVGGAMAVLDDLQPRTIWEGIPVEPDVAMRELAARAAHLGLQWERVIAGASVAIGGVQVHVLNPPPAEWDRMKVRNDDSVAVELCLGDVSIVLPGDAEREAERHIIPRIGPARLRVVKMGHHGSRTSSATGFLAALRPRVAIASAGRGNRFGHPAGEVVARYEAAGASIWRTDRDGEITLETDGRTVTIRGYTGRTEVLRASVP